MEVINIKEEEFNDKVSAGKVLIDCYAEWCGPCKMLGPIIDEIAKEKEDYSFYKLNVDECEKVTREYMIMSIPTLLIFEDGNLKEKLVGFRSKDELEEILK